VPLIPISDWETISEETYSRLLYFQKPKTKSKSKVVILEVDQATLDTYGWPIARKHYSAMLQKMKRSGHPWLWSTLQFQALEKAKSDPIAQKKAARSDAMFAESIRNYERYIGTGIEIKAGEELTAGQEDNLLPRVLISKSRVPADLPYLPLQFTEADRFMEAQQKFGVTTRFGTEQVALCNPMVISNQANPGHLVLPSALVWAGAMGSSSRILTSEGAFWPRTGERVPYPATRNLKIGTKHCATAPHMLTSDFFKKRGIERVGLSEFLKRGNRWNWKDKVVLLANGDSRKYMGPGDRSSDAIAHEHWLMARLLDNLLTGETIQRERLSSHTTLSYLPMVIAVVLIGFMLFLSAGASILMGAAAHIGLATFGLINLLDGSYVIPIQAMASTATTTFGLTCLYLYLRYYGIRRQVSLSDTLRGSLSRINTLHDLETKTLEIAKKTFGPRTQLTFSDYDEVLYLAASDPQRALQLLKTAHSPSTANGNGFHFGPLQTVLTSMAKPKSLVSQPFKDAKIDCLMAVDSDIGRLGTIKLAIGFASHEEIYIGSLITILRNEVAQHWTRIRILAEQKLADYKFLMESTRGDIMERFLSQALVSKFQNDITMEENLKNILEPHPARAALFQADIRGYSDFAADLSPIEVVQILQSYYKNVVEEAQAVAQIKLIGDCIFLFIERGHGNDEYSPADLALQIATVLVRETLTQNEIRVKEGGFPIHFGIAIHYGDVVLGNLSSDHCIDYTVIGKNVNLVARMEEMTKHKEVKELIGENGIILSSDAHNALQKYKSSEIRPMDLSKLGVSVRSFPEVNAVHYITAADALSLANDDALKKMKKAG
jgi:class 3 adenylate cyclase